MYCVGGRVYFADGRQAIARNAEELAKIMAMNVVVTAISCTADSITFEVKISEDGSASATWSNFDTKQAYSAACADIDAVTKAAAQFMQTGERWQGLDWQEGQA